MRRGSWWRSRGRERCNSTRQVVVETNECLARADDVRKRRKIMIQNIRLIRNVGMFDSDSGAANVDLGKLVLIYAENGRGKTTLTSILRSLAANEPRFVEERSRLGAHNPPHVCFNADGQPANVMFQNGVWTRNLSHIKIFDDVFVDTNVHSGLNVEPQHRQNLHELILGDQGVTLNRRLADLVEKNEQYIRDLREKADAFPADILHGLEVDEFCDLARIDEIDDKIVDAERTLAAARNRGDVLSAQPFNTVSLPDFDTAGIVSVLSQGLSDLDSAAEAQVRTHIDRLGDGGENWVSEGMGFLPEDDPRDCPFCGQTLEAAAIIAHYQAYFSAGYEVLKSNIDATVTAVRNAHQGTAQAEFERIAGTIGERRQFWSRFTDIAVSNIDTAAIEKDWNSAIAAVLGILETKKGSPLERIELGTNAVSAIANYEAHKVYVDNVSQEITAANDAIKALKEATVSADTNKLATDLSKLRAAKERYLPDTGALCTDYLATRHLKIASDNDRETARKALQDYRDQVFPTLQRRVNAYLPRFNAGFSVDRVTAANRRGGSYCTYDVVINDNSVPIGNTTPAPGDLSFRNTLSAGDRNTLALALFFSSLDQNPNLANTIVVVDDPVSSLDDHRTASTIQCIGDLKDEAEQVIVLSHNKPFLCDVWNRYGYAHCTTLEIVRGSSGSTIRGWDASSDALTQHDQRHDLLQSYLQNPAGTHPPRDVAQSIRPHLEYFFRVVCPGHCPPGTRIGQFMDRCRQSVNGSDAILDTNVFNELESIVAFSNQFHHDTNREYTTATINDQQLYGFVQRTLRLTGPPSP